MKTRETQNGPIVPAINGQPPQWLVQCLTCGFRHDAHGSSTDEAIESVRATHQDGHKLIAEAVDYSRHPHYGGSHATA